MRRRPPTWVLLLGAYLLTRLAVALATAVVGTLELGGPRCGSPTPVPIEGWQGLVRCWDTDWFVRTALEGYPATAPPGTGDAAQTTLAFFPGFPGVIAALHALGLPAEAAAVLAATGFGGMATLLVHRLARSVADERTAVAAALLFCTFPGAVLLSWGYSEAMAAVLAGATLLALHHRRWWWAGLAAAAAGTVRADVCVALTVACAVAAVLATKRDVRLRHRLAPIAAPLLAPLGGLAFLGFLWWRTGSPTTWLDVQRRGWDQRTDFGYRAGRTVLRILGDPLESPSRLVQAMAVVLLVLLVAAVVRRPPPAAWTAYVVVLVTIALTSNQVGFRPRAWLLLLPAFVAAAVWLRQRPAVLPWLLGAGTVLQVLLTVTWLGTPRILPP